MSVSVSLELLPRLRGGARRVFRTEQPQPDRLVRVLSGWQVVHDGQVRDPGDEITVEGRTAAQWLARSFLEPVDHTPSKRSAPPESHSGRQRLGQPSFAADPIEGCAEPGCHGPVTRFLRSN